MTDTLARKTQSGLVVRYNGGAQAGHHVVTPEGRQHTFSQFGAATFLPGVKTYLSSDVIIHPGALLQEGKALAAQGVPDCFDRLTVSDRSLVVTPFHQAANRIHEMARGAERHGSCGVGIGEAYEDHLEDKTKSILSRDLGNKSSLIEKARNIREHKKNLLKERYGDSLLRGEFEREWQFLTRDEVLDTWAQECGQLAALITLLDEDEACRFLRTQETVLFEGAQGVLLDAKFGFHPYTTWSDCTMANAERLLSRFAPEAEVAKIGITRCHAVRHGPGPLPTETAEFRHQIREHNHANAWQGEVRYGWFDPLLINYALQVTGGVDALVVTHLDWLADLKEWTYCSAYEGMDENSVVRDLAVLFLKKDGSPYSSLQKKEDLTRALMKAHPIRESCRPESNAVLDKIETLTRNLVAFASFGPTALTLQNRGPFFRNSLSL